jgi:hypothetical protein
VSPTEKFLLEILVIDNNSAVLQAGSSKFKAQVIGSLIENDYAALRSAPGAGKTKWVLFVDADEIVSPQLAEEIISVIQTRICRFLSSAYGFSLGKTSALW